MTEYFFYILRCRDNSLYCGQTNNLQKRLKEHQLGKGRSAKYTRGRGPVELVYYEAFDSIQNAMRREREVKKWRKDRKEKLVKSKGSLWE